MDIVEQIRADREEGARRLAREYRPSLTAVAARLCADAAEAEGLVWRTMDEAVRRIGTLADPASFFAWMCGIMSNLHGRDARRKINGSIVYTDNVPDAADDAGADGVIRAVDAALLREAIDGLPPKLKEAVVLRYFMDMPLLQVARFLAVPVGTVNSRLHLARVVLGMRLGAKLKKPAVAIAAVALALLASAAAVVATIGGRAAGRAAADFETFENEQHEEHDMRRIAHLAAGAAAAVSLSAAPAAAESAAGGGVVLATAATAADPYIESDGTAFVNTRWFMNPDGRIEVDYALSDTSPLGASTFRYVFGAADRNASSGIGTRAGFFYNVNGPYFFAGDVPSKWKNAEWQKADTKRRIAAMDVKAGTYLYYVKGEAEAGGQLNPESTVAKTANFPVALFGNMTAANGMSVDTSEYIKARIYRARFWTGEHLDHDYVPCIQGGIVGFKDRVDGAFVTSETATDLTCGGDIEVDNGPAYIANGREAYFDTGYTPTPHTRVEADYLCVDNHKDYRVFGTYSTLTLNHYVNGASNYAWSCQNDAGNFTSTGLPVHKFRRRTFIIDPHTDFVGMVTAGHTNYHTTVTANAGTCANTAERTLKVFADATGENKTDLRLYGFRIYEAGELVRNYTPRVKDCVAGLYDTVTGTFKGSANGYAFSAGGEIEIDGAIDAYIESDGTQAINTRYKMTNVSRVEVDFAYTAAVNSQSAICGSWTCTRNSTACYVNGSGGFSMALADGWGARTLATTADTARHTVILDATAKGAELGYVTGAVTNTAAAADGYVGAGEPDKPMGLLAGVGNAAGTEFMQVSRARVYAFRVYETTDGAVAKVHEYLPYKNGGTVGFRDTVTGDVLTDGKGGNALKIGGKGVDGAERWFATPPARIRLTKQQESQTVSANAAGAVAYRWTKNGEAVSGGEDGVLAIEWRRGGSTDAYTVTAVYDVYGRTVAGEPVALAVEQAPDGMILVVR